MTEATNFFQEIQQNIRQKDYVLNLLQQGIDQNQTDLADVIIYLQDYYFIPEQFLVNAIEQIEQQFTEASTILKIYQNALDSFYYIRLGKLLVQFILKNKYQRKKAEILFEKLLSQFCWDYEEAHYFYFAYIQFETQFLQSANEKEKKQIENQIRQIYQRVIKMPINNLDQFLKSYKDIEQNKQEYEKYEKQFQITQEKIRQLQQIEVNFNKIINIPDDQATQQFFNSLIEIFENKDIELSKLLNYYEKLMFLNSSNFSCVQDQFIQFLREQANIHILSKQLKSLIKLSTQQYKIYVQYLRTQEMLNKDDEEYEQAFIFVQKFVSDENLFNFSLEYIYRFCRQYLTLNEKLDEKQQIIRELFEQLSSKQSYSNEQKAKVFYDLARVESLLFDHKLNARAAFEKCVSLDWEKNNYWRDYYYSQVSQVIGNVQQRDRLRGILKRAVEVCKTENIEAAENWVNFETIFGQVEELIKAEEKLIKTIEQDLGEQNDENIEEEEEEIQEHQKEQEKQNKKKKNKMEQEQVQVQEESEKAPQIFVDSQKTIFVKHIPKDLTSDDVIALIPDCGVMECRIVKDKNQISKGFAYIDFATEIDAQEAVSLLQNKIIKGEKLYAALSKPPKLYQEDKLTLYLDNLPYSITKEKLAEKAGVGIKEIRIIVDEKGQPRGYAYIEFIDDESKNNSFEKLSKEPYIDGRRFYVKHSDSLEKIKQNQQNNSVVIKNIPFKIRDIEIRQIFDGMNIIQINIPKNNEGKPKGFAFVEFEKQKHLKTALEMNGIEYKGRRLEILKSDRKITHKKEEKIENKMEDEVQDQTKPKSNQDFRNLFKK